MKRIKFWFFSYFIEIGLSARWPWSHFKIHSRTYMKHLVWGKFSLIVSQPQFEMVRVCSNCLEEIQVISKGDESWDFCESCQCVEGPTREISLWDFEQVS